VFSASRIASERLRVKDGTDADDTIPIITGAPRS
jgi:hypothetical protein